MLQKHFNNQCRMSYIIFDIKLCYKYLALSWMTCLSTTITFSPILAKKGFLFHLRILKSSTDKSCLGIFPLDLEWTHKSNFQCPSLLYFSHSNPGCKPLQLLCILLLCKCKHKPFLVYESTNLFWWNTMLCHLCFDIQNEKLRFEEPDGIWYVKETTCEDVDGNSGCFISSNRKPSWSLSSKFDNIIIYDVAWGKKIRYLWKNVTMPKLSFMFCMCVANFL
jgi:hypothetical protein